MISSLKIALRTVLTRHPFFVLPFIFLLNSWADVTSKTLLVRSFPLNEYERKLDWQACGIRVASDGNCYFACSSHAPDHGCAFFRYNPRISKLDLLCKDITIVCGEDPERTPPQGKIRSDIVEANGWLYFGTHLANYWREAEAAYTGGHIVGYELATGRFRDYGVIHRNYTIYSGIAVVPERSILYVYVTPYPDGKDAHLYRVDLKLGAKEDLGVLHSYAHAYYLFVDQRGDCWFAPKGCGGTLFRARASDGKLDRWEDLLPPAYSWQNAEAKETDARRCIRWAQPLPERSECIFTMETSQGDSGDMLWVLNTGKKTKDSIRSLARIGPTGLGLARSRGRVYYVQHSYGKSVQKIAAKPIQRILAKVVAKLIVLGQRPRLHLRSVRLDTCSVKDHGLIVDQDGRKPLRVDSVATDGNGVVFIVGDWQLLPGEKGSLLYNYKRKGYDKLTTGQFFAVAQVGND